MSVLFCSIVKKDGKDAFLQWQSHTCQPIQFTSIKYFFFIILGGIWPFRKMDTGKHNLHEILLLF